MNEQSELIFNKEVLNQEYELGTFNVTKQMIQDLAYSIGDTSGSSSEKESHPGGKLVAPTLLPSLFAKFEGPENLDLQFEGVDYMAGQYFEPKAPVESGDVLKCVARVKAVYKKTGRSGPMVFVVREHRFINQRGVIVAIVGLSNVRRK